MESVSFHIFAPMIANYFQYDRDRNGVEEHTTCDDDANKLENRLPLKIQPVSK